MNFLPYEQFSIRTTRSADDVLRRLSGVIGPAPMWFRKGAAIKPFHGAMTVGGFHATPHPLVAFAFSRPRITGRVRRDDAQTTLDVTVTAGPVATLLTAGVLGVCTLSLLAAGRALAFWQGPAVSVQAIPAALAIMLGSAGLFIWALKVQARRAKNFFTRLLADRALPL